jgi:hypothetical protein
MFVRLLGELSLPAETLYGKSVGDVFDLAFARLRTTDLRGEYVYRAALVRNVLMGTHSLATASMLTEFRAGQSKADLVILNGTATVYEIKSERDTLARLEKQVSDYQRVFAKVFVIAGVDHIEEVAELMPPEVGLMCLKRWNRISTIRDAIDCPQQIKPLSVLESIRSSEAQAILTLMGGFVPDVPNTQLRLVLGEAFENLDPTLLHYAMVRVLKKTRNLSPLANLVGSLPTSLQAAALMYKVRRIDVERLVRAVETPVCEAYSWA